MDDVVEQFSSKITKLLDKFLQPSYEVKEWNLIEKFLKHLEASKSSDDCGGSLIDLPVFIEWLMQAVPVWSLNVENAPSAQTCAFTMNLASLLTANEIKFCALNNNNYFVKLVNISKARDAEASPIVKLAYAKLLSSFLEHPSGMEWMIASNFWEDMLEFALSSDNLFVVKAGRRFMSKILDKVIDYDPEFCNNVVKKIMMPLGDHTSKTVKATNMSEMTEENVCDRIRPTLQLLGFLLEYFLESSLLAKQDSRVVELFSKIFQLEQRISDLMLIAQNKLLIFDLGRIMMIMKFLDLHFTMISGLLTVELIQQFVDRLLDIFSMKLSCQNYENVMKFCCFGQLYWKLINEQIPVILIEPKKEFNVLPFSMIMFLLLPVCLSTWKFCVDDYMKQICQDEIRDVYIQKILSSLDYQSLRGLMAWKHALIERPDLFDFAAQSLVLVLKHRKVYSRDQAVTIVQTLIYGFYDLVLLLKQDPTKYEKFIQGETSIALRLDALTLFIEEFQVTWRDSVETIDLMDITFEFLTIPRWPPILVVKAMNLLHMTLKYYMSPNLALLVDRTSDSKTGVMGFLLDVKLQDCWWKTRKAALETLTTLTNLSSISK